MCMSIICLWSPVAQRKDTERQIKRFIGKVNENLKKYVPATKLGHSKTLATPKKACTPKPVVKHMHGDPRPYFRIEHFGYIVLDEKNQRFEAQCGCIGSESAYTVEEPWLRVQDHSTDTQPVCRLHRIGSKRPLGFLIVWLREGYLWHSHAQHLEGRRTIRLADRRKARDWLEGQTGFEPLLEAEKKWCGDTGKVVEPLEIT